ncbi:Butyrophilin subfamily 2 member A1 [Nibea albiflora]|uniref:Butyrophilin subfamily 2 member A1 n=1 Tax=Nibea albiflora TaxID=240163 RepID=A0ACB7FKW9_NIBAL|nr:Butyrophilin subfamily 2 member A1 [Nibea albiflora]
MSDSNSLGIHAQSDDTDSPGLAPTDTVTTSRMCAALDRQTCIDNPRYSILQLIQDITTRSNYAFVFTKPYINKNNACAMTDADRTYVLTKLGEVISLSNIFRCDPDCIRCSSGESRPSSQTQRIEAEVHDNVTLQCDLDPRVNIENNTIVCDRVDLNKKVHAYRGKQDHPHEQMDQYRGRTTLNREDLSRGVLTLLISSVQTSDSGPYRCFVPKRKSSCTFNLTVDGAHMKAVHAGIITTAVIALCVLVVVLVVKRRTIQDCLKRLRVKKRTSNGSEERDEDQERPLKTVV